MKEEKRNPRSYKIRDAAYDRAFKRAVKNSAYLANIVEQMVELYAMGFDKMIIRGEFVSGIIPKTKPSKAKQ